MEGEPVEHRGKSTELDLRQVEREVWSGLAARDPREMDQIRPCRSPRKSQPVPRCPNQNDRKFELQMRKGQLDGIGGRSVGGAHKVRARPRHPMLSSENPGTNHEYLEAFDSYFPGAKIEYYYYDKLGSSYSDQPKDPELINLPRYVEEVEQVRKALGLNKSNFYLYGQSWGGILAMEYALKYQQNLKGLIISNMMSSVPEYNAYC